MPGTSAAGVSSTDHLGSALIALGRAGRSIALYSAEHPLALEALRAARRALQSAVDSSGAVVLSLEGDVLRVNGVAAPTSSVADSLRQRLKALHIVRLVFEQEVTAPGLAKVVRLLSAEPEAVFRDGGPLTPIR